MPQNTMIICSTPYLKWTMCIGDVITSEKIMGLNLLLITHKHGLIISIYLNVLVLWLSYTCMYIYLVVVTIKIFSHLNVLLGLHWKNYMFPEKDKLYSREGLFTVTPMHVLNSKSSEFGLVEFKDELYFSSNRSFKQLKKDRKEIDRNTHIAYYDVFRVPATAIDSLILFRFRELIPEFEERRIIVFLRVGEILLKSNIEAFVSNIRLNNICFCFG